MTPNVKRQSTTVSTAASRRSTRALTLVELLVVMVILVIGIFGIVRIFPLGLQSLNHARNMTAASRLAQAELERWKVASANVPDGILAEDPETALKVRTDFNPDDMRTANSANPAEMPEGQDSWYWSNVNRARLVKGETTVIPAPTLLPYAEGDQRNYAYSIYNLKFAPVQFSESDKGQNLPQGFEWPDQHVLIYGDPLTRVNVTGLSSDDRDNTLASVNRNNYAIDYDSGKVYLYSTRWTRRYKIDYAYWENNKLGNSTEILIVPGQSNRGEIVELQLEHGNIDDYSDRLARKFQYVQPGNFDDRNPYQFTLLNGYAQLDFAPTIGFNPIGRNVMVRTNLGQRPLTAHIDYEVLDWHVLREERTIPAPANVAPNYSVRLTLPNVKIARVTTVDGIETVNAPPGTRNVRKKYKGITPAMDGYSVVALDLTDNTLMVDNNGPGGLQVDYAAGIVRFPGSITKYTPFGGTLTNQDVRGHDVRIFYQAVDDWAVQTSKAWSNYQRRDVPGNSFENLQYNQFDARIHKKGGDWVATLTFPRSDAGKSIEVSLNWTDNDGATHAIDGRQFQLPKFGQLGAGYPSIDVPFARSDEYTYPGDDEVWKNPYFTFVQGASVKVRAIWREKPQRWEMRTLETTLKRQ